MTQPEAPTAQSRAGRAESAAIYRRAGVVTFYTLLSRILGMMRDLVIAHQFGASAASDAWVQAFRIPNALRRLTAEGSMTIAFVPVYVEAREKEGAEAARRFAQRVLGVVLASTVLLAALGMIFSDELTWISSPGFNADPAKFALTSLLTRWSFPYLVLVSLVAWAMGVLNSEHRYAAPAAAPIFLNIGIIAGVLWMAGLFEQPIVAVSAGVLLGGVAQVLLQLPSLAGTKSPLLPRFDWSDPHLARLMRLLGPSLLSVAVYQLNIVILGIIASYLPSGQIFYYNNANRLTELAMGLFTFAFATAGLPSLSEHVSRRDWPMMSSTSRLTFSAVLFTTLPATVGLMAAAPAIVSMLYLHGAYSYADVLDTAATLQWMALGMPAVAAVRVMVPIYYALQDTRTPAVLSVLGLIVTTLISWQLSLIWEVRGLAAGLSAGSWVYCLALAWRLRNREVALKDWFPAASLVRQIAASLVTALFAALVIQLGEWPLGPHSLWNWAVFIVAMGGAIALYAGVSWALGEPEVRNWFDLIQRASRAIQRRMVRR